MRIKDHSEWLSGIDFTWQSDACRLMPNGQTRIVHQHRIDPRHNRLASSA